MPKSKKPRKKGAHGREQAARSRLLRNQFKDPAECRRLVKIVEDARAARHKGSAQLGYLFALADQDFMVERFIEAFMALERWQTTEEMDDFSLVNSMLMIGAIAFIKVGVQESERLDEIRRAAYAATLAIDHRNMGRRIPDELIEDTRKEIELCCSEYEFDFYGVESIGQSDRVYVEVLNKIDAAKCAAIVVDESIKIKNLRAKRTQRLLHMGERCEYKLILNGTPITKNILDIYAQMLFLSPKILDKNFFKFRDDYCVYSTEHRYGKPVRTYITGYANVEHLLSIIEPYVYECSLDLPLAKKYRTLTWHMTETERFGYENLKCELIAAAEDDFEILGAMQKLHHFYTLASEKVPLITPYVDDRTIIYCRFIAARDYLQEMFPQALVMTYGKGSFGLNLQKYRRIIYFDKTFDYAFREQSEARIYRMGQQESCEYFDLTGADIGLEELFDKCIAKKLTLVNAFKLSGMKLEDL